MNQELTIHGKGHILGLVLKTMGDFLQEAKRTGASPDSNPAGDPDVAEYRAELWRMDDALRGSMDAAEYKHVVLGLIFLKYISHGEGASDPDFPVEFQSLPAGAYADAYFGLLEALERLFGSPVDLVVDSAIRNPFFRQRVEETRTQIYAA